jgi:hypothetical protein
MGAFASQHNHILFVSILKCPPNRDGIGESAIHQEPPSKLFPAPQKSKVSQVSRIVQVPGIHDSVPFGLPGNIIGRIAGSHGDADHIGELERLIHEKA